MPSSTLKISTCLPGFAVPPTITTSFPVVASKLVPVQIEDTRTVKAIYKVAESHFKHDARAVFRHHCAQKKKSRIQLQSSVVHVLPRVTTTVSSTLIDQTL